ncbi:MAG: aspartate carbamoyltransferase [Methylococcales bacterium]|nr:aspartate carbamoyltransferase [Methylococcales bacterium]
MKKITLLTLVLISTNALAVEPASEARLDEVVSHGIHVMPFDLEKTLHVFTKVEKGGVQQVIVKDKNDAEQIALIRQHLSKIAREFNQGDFSNPVKIHGDKMPGLEVLKKAEKGTLSIIYKELPDGAQIDYTSEKADLVAAIHQFFDAQLSDHARHAVSGHANHHSK